MSLSIKTLIAIAIGGGLGSILRAYTVFYSNKFYPMTFPLGILIVNIIGSFIIGFLYIYFSSYIVSDNVKFFLTTGFLGGLTTFSTFALDSYLLFGASLNLAILNILSNFFGSIIAVAIGVKLAQLLLK